MSYFFMYVIVKLSSVVSSAGFICFSSMALFILSFILTAMLADSTNPETGRDFGFFGAFEKFKRARRIFLVSFVISGILFVFIPTSKEAAAIYVIPQIVNNEQIQGIADNSLKSIYLLSEQWVQSLAPENIIPPKTSNKESENKQNSSGK